MISYLKKNWKIIIFAGAIALGVFLRVWHFHDWLFFKMDQARDAVLIKNILENGFGWLPLLGPKAGGTHLNLGPVFYYFQAVSAFLFQSASPSVLAYPDLLFSILSIPLFYFFLKKYFSRDWSMLVTGLYAICFLGIQYSRFAWNPNSLVFFNLLYFYALLSVFDENTKKRLRWMIIAGVSFAVSTQLHFLSFATLPVVTLIFAAWNRKTIGKTIGWKNIAIFAGVILVIYIPVVVHDIVTDGRNTSAFIDALREKPSDHTLWQNFNRNVRYWGQHWLLIAVSWISKKGNLISSAIAWSLLMIPGLTLAILNFRKEKNQPKKNFLLISILWFFAYFIIYIPIAYQIRPRFFLPMLALPFIFTGYILHYLCGANKKIFKLAALALVAAIFFGNITGTYLWFREINTAQKKGIDPERTIILKARDGIILWHLENAQKYIQEDCDKGPVYYYTSSEYKRPVEYLVELNGLRAAPIDSLYLGQKECVYGVMLTRSAKTKLPGRITDKFEKADTRKFGAMTVFKLSAKDEFVGQPLGFADKPLPEASLESERKFLKDVLK